MNMTNVWTNATGIAAGAFILLWASTAWAGYMNWDVRIDETNEERAEIPLEGPVQFEGTAKDVDIEPVYDDPPKSEWVRMTVRDSSESPVAGSAQIEVVNTEKVDDRKRRLHFELEWQPKAKLRPGATYSFEIELLSEIHGNQQYRSNVTGSFTTAGSDETADTGTTTGGTTDTGTSTDTGVAGAPDTGGVGHWPDSGASWSDTGTDASSGATGGGTSGKEGSERGMCSQTDGPVPLGAFGLTVLVLGCTRIGTRRDSRSRR